MNLDVGGKSRKKFWKNVTLTVALVKALNAMRRMMMRNDDTEYKAHPSVASRAV